VRSASLWPTLQQEGKHRPRPTEQPGCAGSAGAPVPICTRSPVQPQGDTRAEVRDRSLSNPVGKVEGTQSRREIARMNNKTPSQRKTDHVLLVTELPVETVAQQSLSLPTCNIFKTIKNEKKRKNTAHKSQYGMSYGNVQILHRILAQSDGN